RLPRARPAVRVRHLARDDARAAALLAAAGAVVTPRSVQLGAAAALLPLGSCAWLDERMVDLHDSVLYRWHESALGVAATAKAGPLELALGGWYAEWGWGKDTWWQQP